VAFTSIRSLSPSQQAQRHRQFNHLRALLRPVRRCNAIKLRRLYEGASSILYTSPLRQWTIGNSEVDSMDDNGVYSQDQLSAPWCFRLTVSLSYWARHLKQATARASQPSSLAVRTRRPIGAHCCKSLSTSLARCFLALATTPCKC
jgi:hypothetical protein